ncbi:TcpQ domain-containing protein [Providencia sp. R33]|uniref:TcpQ domain-containing protein n=1 Tax=Providencia TaxID=586 RepID=UPI001C5A9875|nr:MULTISPECIES: TcpQ domain-containing protein [Providencia]QXX84114.1 TcpQ domain-containing protein [Providencia sp. R33]
MKKYNYLIMLCGFTLNSFANTDIEVQEWINLKPMKEIKAITNTPQLNTQLNQEKIEGKSPNQIDFLSELVLKKNELLSQSVEEWAKYNGIDFIWNSPKDIVVFNEIKIEGKNKIEVMEKLGKQLSYQKAGFYLKFYEKNNVLVIDN